MKVKQRREDFVVREVNNFHLGAGSFATYRLEKSGIGTGEAIDHIVRHWGLARHEISYGGRKDRHAVTLQTVTIKNGQKAELEEDKFSLRYVGQSRVPFTAKDIVGNDFEIQLRNLEPDPANKMLAYASSPTICIPNYFDQQRFGSVGYNGEFVAQPWCLGNYERAVYLALAEGNQHDSPVEREEKEILRDHWGDWVGCKARLQRSNRRSVVTYLVDHPEGFKKAAALIQRDLRSMYVSAFQSRLWNEVTARVIRDRAGNDSTNSELIGGHLCFPQSLEESALDELRTMQIALPSGRKTKRPVEIEKLLTDVCGEFDLQVHQLRLSHPRDVFFSRANRNVLLGCEKIEADLQTDELAEDRQKLQLKFRLLPGQYATMLIKGLELHARESQSS